MGTCCCFQIIKDADNDVSQLAPEIVTVISQVAGSWLDNIFNSAEDAKDEDKLISENKAKTTSLIPRPPGRIMFNYTLDSYVPVQWKE